MSRPVAALEEDGALVLSTLAASWHRGETLTAEELAAALGWPLARTERRLRRLEAQHLVYRRRRWATLRPGVAWGRSR